VASKGFPHPLFRPAAKFRPEAGRGRRLRRPQAPRELAHGAQQQQRVDSTALLLIADLQNTQTRALQRYYNDTWGVHIADSAKVYTVFHGTSYNSTDSYNYMVSYPSSVSVSPDQDIVFESGSGELDSGTTTITVTSTTLPTEAVTININEQGLID
jgi:hypothetical protein